MKESRKVAKIIAVMTTTILLLWGSVAVEGKMEKETEALKAAETWLVLVDEGHYVSSWDTAAVFFKKAVTSKEWVRLVEAVRGPLGTLISRNVRTLRYTTTRPGAPDGEYVVILFETSFEGKRNARETVTPMMGTDGVWRVSGYYLK